MTQDQVIIGLQAEKDNFLAQECVAAFQQNPDGFNEGIVQTREYLAGLYTTRFRIAKSIKRSFFENEEISSWEAAIKQLSNSAAEEVRLNAVKSEEKSYMMFWDTSSKQLITIFYLYTENSQDL